MTLTNARPEAVAPDGASGTVLVPIAPGAPARELIDIARALTRGGEKARVGHSRAVVLSVVEVPPDKSLSQGATVARRRRALLKRLGAEVEADPSVEFSVRAARTLDQGIREAVEETAAAALILGWRGTMRSEFRLRRSPLDSLILSPPCDVMIFKPARPVEPEEAQPSPETAGPSWPPKNILLPIRGGPYAQLSLSIGRRIAASLDAQLTVMRIRREGAGPSWWLENEAEAGLAGVHLIEVTSDDVEEAIALESEHHDLLILGASARHPRASHLFGYLPELLADRTPAHVLIVKTAAGVPPELLEHPPTPQASPHSHISTLVDQWFAENTFHSHEFEDIDELVARKQGQNLTISVALPALNEENTIGKIISVIKQRFMDQYPLIDEMVVIDSNSEDATVAIAESMGIPVFAHSEILPEHGTHIGKGEGLWKGLHVTSGDIVIWIDSDITDIHPRFIHGIVGPLLTQPRLQFVKGYYRRPLNIGEGTLATGGGRVTELTARPLINLFYPQLSGLVQPLAGEMAGRRALLEQLPFFTGYGVETGLLIDILERSGIDCIAQTDLENRIHRNQDVISLSKMAFAIVQVVVKRLEGRRHIDLLEEINTTMKLIHYTPEELFLEEKEIREFERPPIVTIPEYVAIHPRTAEPGRS